jgi:hypothetical protein
VDWGQAGAGVVQLCSVFMGIAAWKWVDERDCQMKETILAGVVLAMLAGAVQAVTNVAPTVVVNSAAMRPGTTYMDISFRVNDPDDATVKVRALAFIDGVRSFANVVRAVTFVEGTDVNAGDSVPTNADLALTWDVMTDWDIDLASVKFEILARDQRGLLWFDWIAIPATTNPVQSELTISKNAPTDAEVLNALFWLYADGDAGLVLTNGNLVANAVELARYDGMTLVAGTTMQKPWAPVFPMMRMNLKPADGPDAAFALSARSGLLTPDRLRALNQAYEESPIVPGAMVLVEGGTLPSIGNGVLNVSDFYIGQYEVTKAEWDAVRGWAITNGYAMNVGSGTASNHPVHTVNWYDVVKWCNAKSEMDGLAPVYQVGGVTYKTGSLNDVAVVPAADGYRLPTDAEWEYAARGGKYSQGWTYSGGNDVNAVAWYSSNSGSKTWPVGLKMDNELGLHDMSGNVWEWCFDWHPACVGSSRVNRGGGWIFSVSYCRVSYRGYVTPSYLYSGSGFRLARLAGL